jgi:hypothetical protein
MAKTFGIEVTTDRFDQSSELPMDINAGNRFYGSDFAAFLKERLRLHYGISDWHDVDDRFDGRPVDSPPTQANWYVIVSACRSARWLGLIPYEQAVDCPASYGEELLTIFAAEGMQVLRSGIG